MTLLCTINDSSKSILFKTKTIGPLSIDNYKKIKQEDTNVDKNFINYYISWIKNNNNYIYRVIEVTKYYLVDKSSVITDNYLICIKKNKKEKKHH